MYFNSDKNNTNIDNQFKKENQLFFVKEKIKQYKFPIIITLIIILLIVIILFFVTKKEKNYLVLNGEENITLYQGTDYIEPGYSAHNSKNEDLTSKVSIKSTLNTNKIGEYEIIYTLDEITKVRKIKVIEKTKEYTYIYLNTINGSINMYLKVGEPYVEPGFSVFNSAGKNLNDSVKITGSVDTTKKGNYQLIYSVVDSNNVVASKVRNIIVMDSEINLSLNNSSYTNTSVTINVGILDNFFDYMILPNNEKTTKNIYEYKVTENGKYTFTVYNNKGMIKKSTIEVKNIDRVNPTGSCSIENNTKGSTINIKASDNSGIKKYVYNNQSYTSNKITLSKNIDTAKVTIYDKAGNTKEVSCKSAPKVYINNITKDGVIIKINAKKVNSQIAGYYFSYNNKRPNKDSGGYIATNKESIDVVRLAGTTYVWVEDTLGNISNYQTITVDNNALLMTVGDSYTILKDTELSAYLKNKGWSIEELNKLMIRSVRAAGLYTKEAAATSAVAIQTVLAQKYKIKMPYWWAGKNWKVGADPTWGKYKVTSNSSLTYYYYGLDCSGFTTWVYVNAGYNIKSGEYPSFWRWKRITFNKDNGEIGDFLVYGQGTSAHIKLIVGKTSKGFITAEAKSKANGMVVDVHNYNNPAGYQIVKGDKINELYPKMARAEYPTGF